MVVMTKPPIFFVMDVKPLLHDIITTDKQISLIITHHAGTSAEQYTII